MEEIGNVSGLGRAETSGLVFRQLEIFHAIMTTGSVSGASRLLAVSQPSLSRSLKRLEDQLGLPLFHRHRQRLLPSEEARRLFDEVDPIIAQMRALTGSIVNVVEGQTSLFRFAHTQSVGRLLVPHAIRLMKSKMPALKVFLDALPRAQHVDYLLNGKGECLVSLARLDHPLLVGRDIARAPLVAVMAADHPLADRRILQPEDFAGVETIGFEHDGPHFAAIARFFRDAGEQPRFVAFVRFADAGLALAAQGVGVALLDGFTAAGTLPEGTVMRPLTGPASFTARLYWSSERPGSRFVQALGDALVTAIGSYDGLSIVEEAGA